MSAACIGVVTVCYFLTLNEHVNTKEPGHGKHFKLIKEEKAITKAALAILAGKSAKKS